MKTRFKIHGEFAYRILKNFTRLQEKEYRPEFMARQADEGYCWPGDWEGRLLLALMLESEIIGIDAIYLNEIIEMLLDKLEIKGYLGEKRNIPEEIDEQQLAGHNWLLRGLMQYNDVYQNDKVESAIHRLVETLYLPIIGKFCKYPLGKCRSFDGEAMGSLQDKEVDGWLLSTDIGCAFISIDALSQYYYLYRNEAVLQLLKEMADTFMNIDYLDASMQTHASLSAARGILRMYQATGEFLYLKFAKAFFELYCNEGITENYANYNWFGRPTWTEPCAIVDSYLLAMELYKETEIAGYLECANRILYNAMLHAQRENGGFGCDKCVGPEEEILYSLENYYEAYWCCTMRGAEGLTYAVKNSFVEVSSKGIFTNYMNMDYVSDNIELVVKTGFPYEGNCYITISKCPENYRFKFFIPSYVNTNSIVFKNNGVICQYSLNDSFVEIVVSSPCILEFQFPIALCFDKAMSVQDKKVCWYGVLQLGCDEAENVLLEREEDWFYNGNGIFNKRKDILYPLNQTIYQTRESALKKRIRILF